MADIAKALHLGVEDVLLKPVKISTACETVFTTLYPNMFNSRVEERLFRDWDAMVSNPTPQRNYLQELQPRYSR